MADGNKTYMVKANGFEFSFTDAEIGSIDLIKTSAAEFNLLKDHRSINARLTETDATGKKLKIEIEGEDFFVEIQDELDQQLQKMGFGTVVGKAIKNIKAPMPGLVLEVAVADGQELKEGDKVLILAAMKMENCILTHAPATVKKVLVVAGQAVEKGQVLVELE